MIYCIVICYYASATHLHLWYLGPLTRVTWSTSTPLYQHQPPGRTSCQTFCHRQPSCSSCRLTDLELTARKRFGINSAVIPAPTENFPVWTVFSLIALSQWSRSNIYYLGDFSLSWLINWSRGGTSSSEHSHLHNFAPFRTFLHTEPCQVETKVEGLQVKLSAAMSLLA